MYTPYEVLYNSLDTVVILYNECTVYCELQKYLVSSGNVHVYMYCITK